MGIEKQIKAGLEFVDPDDLDDYVSGTCNDGHIGAAHFHRQREFYHELVYFPRRRQPANSNVIKNIKLNLAIPRAGKVFTILQQGSFLKLYVGSCRLR